MWAVGTSIGPSPLGRWRAASKARPMPNRLLNSADVTQDQYLAGSGAVLPVRPSKLYVRKVSNVLLLIKFVQIHKMINIAGIISIILFYILILGVGIWAGRKKEEGNDSEEEVMLAGRNIGLFVGIFTMTGEIIERFMGEEKVFRKCSN
ncbi:hypothetical protein JTB14_033608 [Gonioctena quinquepunctata]|nr:hypothetical protein JTB14_033608 [Gonioctena quinquepunctata]